MKISFLLVLSFLALLSCNSNEKTNPVKPATKQSTKTDYEFNGFPAYSISKDIDAIVFELGNEDEKDLFFNEIFTEVEKEDTLFEYSDNPIRLINSTYIDTSGQFNIFRSEKLEKRIKEKLKPSYYVYGTKGFTKANLGDVYFTVDECLSNIIAVKLNNYDRKKYGNALFCSEKPLNLIYGKGYGNIEKIIHGHEKELCLKADYCNKPNCSKVIANIGSNYFTYEDDFNWKIDFDRDDINFPSRVIYNIDEKGRVNSVWGKCLDLLGIPCD